MRYFLFFCILYDSCLTQDQQFDRFVYPKPGVQLNTDDSLPSVYPSASSGVFRGERRPIYPSSSSANINSQSNSDGTSIGSNVAEVDSLDLYPNQPPSIRQSPYQPPSLPEFRVVQPPIFPPNPPSSMNIGNRGMPTYPIPEEPEPSEPEEEVEETESQGSQGPPAPAIPEKPDNAYEINFCDKREFPDDVLSSYGLERVDYFIWNATCSSTFFQCSIGHTFLLRCSSDDQAFDRTTTNCNFKNAVKVCPEYDHVMHCTIKETCSDMEYACCSMPQQCLPLQKRCDGHADCGDGDDENNCPSCKRDEFACVKSGLCISSSLRCDGVPDDCADGSNLDEIGCSKNSTCVGKFMCNQSKDGPSCIDWTNHCNGEKDCVMGEDETNCRQPETKYLLCENQKQSVTKQQWCNGEADCADGSDEKYCY